MFYKNLEKELSRSAFFKEFDVLLGSGRGKILFHNLTKSAKSLLLARAFRQTGKNVILICADDKFAEDYLEDLDLLLGRHSAYFLPDFEVLPYEKRSPHYSIRAQRIETLAAAISSEPAIFVLSLRALLRKITAAEIFARNIILLKKGETYSPDLLVSNLVGMGYENQFQVSKVGEIARRGGIIDLFSPDLDRPVRIEFFGDEIESIRVFSINSQRSTGEELSVVRLIPSREFSLHDIETSDFYWQKIHKNGFYEGIELDIPLLLPETQSFLDYFIREKCLFFWDEFQFIKLENNDFWQETTELFEKAKSVDPSLLPPQDLFESFEHIVSSVNQFDSFYLNSTCQEITEVSLTVEAPFTVQSNLFGSLDVLEKEIELKLKKGYRIFLQSDNKSQSKRMMDLLPAFLDKISFSIGVLQNGFNLSDAKLAVYTDHEIFSRYRSRRRQAQFSKEEALVDYDSLKPGDYIVHINHGIGIYAGLKKLNYNGNLIECLILKYADNDVVYVPTNQLFHVSRFVSEEGIAPVIHKLGSKKWEATKNRAKKQIELIATDLIKLYAERKLRKGICFDSDSSWQKEMEDSFIYEVTPDQQTASDEIKKDMEADVPMERLLCGDVGFGKTEVAIRAAFKAIMSGWQVAVLVPTTLLAEQHFLVFRERLAQYPVRIAMFSRFRSAAQLRKDIVKLAAGEIDIAIGTHRLISKDVKYKRLGLLIIDEEHRFGVRHKDKLRQLKTNVDTLYMSATPIPRTMYMALSRLKELSLIRTSPKARLPIRTVIVPWDLNIIKDAILREVNRSGQVYFVHNRVKTIDSIANELKKLLPHVSFGIGHGQLPEKQLEAVTLDFAHHKFDVLVASTIIESGLDIPNANTIIVNRADTFGLAQLYQIRGRVGRSNRRAYAYLIIPQKLPDLARKRLETLIEYESLGSGYQIAMRDMELRGAGAILGTKQSGIINSIGFNYYNRLLEKAIEDLESEKPSIRWENEEIPFLPRLQIQSDYYFPESYIDNEKDRLEIYRRMLQYTEPEQFSDLQNELIDRFGKLPAMAKTTLDYFRLRLLTSKTGLEAITIRNNEIRVEFSNSKTPSRKVLQGLMDKINLPFRIDVTRNFCLIFQTGIKDQKEQNYLLEQSLKIAEYLFVNTRS